MIRYPILLACLMAPTAAQAASVVTLAGEDSGQRIDNQVIVDDGRIKLLIRDAQGVTEVQFHGDTRITYVIDHERRSYLALTEAGIEETAARLQGMVSEVQNQLSGVMQGMNDEQREQMENMLQNMGLGGTTQPASPPARYRDTGNRGSVNGFDCRVGYIYRGDTAISQLCVASREELGLPEEDYVTLRQAASYGSQVAEKAASVLEASGSAIPAFDIQGMDGLPVEVRDNAALIQVTGIESRNDLPPITIPTGYTESKNPLLVR